MTTYSELTPRSRRDLAQGEHAATDQLYERYPDAQPWVIRIGHRALYRFGLQ